MTSVPLACSLTADGAAALVEEWGQFVKDRVVEIARTGRSARLRIADGDDDLMVAASLARREKSCCPFFEFRIVFLAETIWLEIDAPEEGAEILDGLVNLQGG